MKSLNRVRLLVTPWTAAYQAPLSMGFSRQEYWSGVPLPFPLLSLKVTFSGLREDFSMGSVQFKVYPPGIRFLARNK